MTVRFINFISPLILFISISRFKFEFLFCVDTKHSALEMMCSDDFSLKPVLVLQVVLSFHNYICLSDGKNVVSALVPLNLVDESRCYEVDILSSGFKDELVHSTMPQVGTIVKLTNYTLKEFQRHK
jgi:hypothetical protein